ncbi:hypothetical protein BC826DRAFT_1177755 [Russula brevipes]|nr:hypothetical protein BC826DRAFT_1177755 [Russula brevipes]
MIVVQPMPRFAPHQHIASRRSRVWPPRPCPGALTGRTSLSLHHALVIDSLSLSKNRLTELGLVAKIPSRARLIRVRIHKIFGEKPKTLGQIGDGKGVRTGGAIPLVPGVLRTHSGSPAQGFPLTSLGQRRSAVQPDPRLSVVPAWLGLKEMTGRAKAVTATACICGKKSIYYNMVIKVTRYIRHYRDKVTIE